MKLIPEPSAGLVIVFNKPPLAGDSKVNNNVHVRFSNLTVRVGMLDTKHE